MLCRVYLKENISIYKFLRLVAKQCESNTKSLVLMIDHITNVQSLVMTGELDYYFLF